MDGAAQPQTAAAPSLLICGTGALACLFAARLSAGGVGVTMLGSWPEGLAALHHQGVCLVAEDGSQMQQAVRTIDARNPEAVGVFPLALVLVKSWQTPAAAAQVARFLAPGGLAVTLQNGLGNLEILAAALGQERAALGVTTAGAALLAPGQVRLASLGSISLGGTHPALEQLANLLRQAGFNVEVAPPGSQNTQALLWSKLVVSAALNPLTALLRVPNGELLERPSARALLRQVAQETAAVAHGLGLALPFLDAAGAAEEVARQTASNHSSMLQDVLRRAPTEIDAICGAIYHTACRLGLPAPHNWALWQLLQAISPTPSNNR